MSDQYRNSSEDTYDVLHKNFNLFGDTQTNETEESDVKNSGEIYFSANPSSVKNQSPPPFDFNRYTDPPQTKNARTAYSTERPVSANRVADAGRSAAPRPQAGTVKKPQTKNTKTSASAAKKKKKRKKSSSVSFMLSLVIIVFVLAASFVIRIPIMGCVSDILAIDRGSAEIRVILDKSMKTREVISLLGEKKLIYSSGFCKAVSGFLGYESDDIFPAGTYYLSPDMGLEGMLKEIMSAGATDATVSITFPEGFTVDQIIARLSQNGVASENALYKALEDDSLYEEYEFLANLTNKQDRYRALEGYLYPDTYEFYIDENPISVFKRFIDNFEKKWEEKFAASYEGNAHTIDEVITVASILEKEAKDSEQMGLIASILYNRLNSSSFPWINCDSTAKYIEAQKEKLEAEGTYAYYLKSYDTYQQTGLPIGPICNPGSEAIEAAISPDNTDYYYFLHDKDGKIYTARTEAEHNANQQYMDSNS